MTTLETFLVGDARIIKVPELALDTVDATQLFPEGDIGALNSDATHWGEQSFDFERGLLRQSIHAWAVQTPTHTVLIDTATGNDKQRPTAPLFHQLEEPFLERLQAVGISPEAVDFVLLTHLHADHVGWNTRLQGGHWVPTFPNARYIFSEHEYAYNLALFREREVVASIQQQAGMGTPRHEPLDGVFEDSVMPIVEAGLDQRIVIDNSVIEGFCFHSTPGHSIDHASISLTSRGETALFWGDIMHHPLQFRRPEINSIYCEFPQAAQRSRHKAMQLASELDAQVFTTHFGDSSVGRVSRHAHGFDWQFIQGVRP
ncbi:MBL fold metallo-hydrolase [Halomonas sp. LR3S48]|uniref:MBL fold metallo-hydrolase n=1 Tax=Halomonas sp. LR3S48 TaxID=2982694 RepID=UPI0021E3A737|nr:MBL fold metallo-hydrolase [Halomonas sp. LR3S48]UYG04628.1 MBL fold metallo-hydrolase [Halomonas sp. LR3S48]